MEKSVTMVKRESQPTMALAQFISGLQYEDIPIPCLKLAKAVFLDSIGCGLYGYTLPWGRMVTDWVVEQGGRPEATLWLTGFKGPAANAALAMGTMIHSFDFDDYHHSKLHPGAAVVPAILAMGERQGSQGQELLTALVAGYETMIRVSLGTGPGPSRMKGWHLTGTCGTFGAAAAAAKLLGLDAAHTASALGLAGTQSAGLWAFIADGSQSKRLHPGRAAQSGIMAAMLAQKGYPGPTKILEAEDGGFCSATSDDYDLEQITNGLGETFETAGVTIKPYSACGSLHSAIDAARALMTKHNIAPHDIQKVILRTSHVIVTQCGFPYQPLSILQAQMSAQYTLAVAIQEGNALPDQYSPDKIGDPQILDLAHRVEITVDPEIDRVYPGLFANKVEILLRNGRSHLMRVDYPMGSTENPMTETEIEAKFRSLAGKVIDDHKASRVVQIANALEDLKGITPLMEMIALGNKI
ncbi:MAG: MmgE/PrpD family protein [Chloroflexi bacterium]|nr:MmgE/PrpD family protein [Chloroflexota bacterium]